MLTGSIPRQISSALRKRRVVSPWCLRALASTSVALVSVRCERGQRRRAGGMDMMNGLYATNVVYAASVGLVTWMVVVLLNSIMKALNTECVESSPSGLTFEDPDSPSRIPVPSIHVQPAKTITVVFPAFNEGSRLKAAVDEAIEHLTWKRKQDSRFSYEVIIVDDGSSDDTYAKAMKFVQRYGLDTVRVLRLPVNKGKGAAVRAGILAGRGETLLFADSDGATQFGEVDKLSARLDSLTTGKVGKESTAPSVFQTVADRHGMVIGSRAHLEHTEAVAKRHWCRNLLMHGFHFLVLLVIGPGVKDTQCGFKLFTRETAKVLFHNMRLQRWCFDVELIFLANRLRVPIAEENVAWTEVAGSKIKIWSTVSMAFELFLIKAAYTSGAWTVLGQYSAVDS